MSFRLVYSWNLGIPQKDFNSVIVSTSGFPGGDITSQEFNNEGGKVSYISGRRGHLFN